MFPASNTELKCRHNGGHYYDVFVLKDNTLKNSPSGMKACLFYLFSLESSFSKPLTGLNYVILKNLLTILRLFCFIHMMECIARYSKL